MSEHAILSASSSHRWLNCTPSARLELEYEDNESPAAAEGTAAHALAEYKLKRALKKRAKKPVSEYDSEEMDKHTDDYVSFVLEKYEEAKQNCKDPEVLIEQRLDFSDYVPDGFGTGDAVILADRTLYIVDFKYGQGVVVDAYQNPQMMLYALGALTQFGMLYNIEEISMSIFQPRRENVSTWTIKWNELLNWANNFLKPKAEEAYNGTGEYCSGEWCRFCKASVKCRARAERHLELAKYEFKQPPVLDDIEIECILPVLADFSAWANSLIAYAEAKAINEGKKWAGYKVVAGRSVRKFTDEKAVVKAAEQAGYTDIYKKSLITLTEFEKLMGKETFREILGQFVTKPAGKLTLVPNTDKRPEVDTSTAKQIFEENI